MSSLKARFFPNMSFYTWLDTKSNPLCTKYLLAFHDSDWVMSKSNAKVIQGASIIRNLPKGTVFKANLPPMCGNCKGAHIPSCPELKTHKLSR